MLTPHLIAAAWKESSIRMEIKDKKKKNPAALSIIGGYVKS